MPSWFAKVFSASNQHQAIKDSSIELEGGGDTHIHPHKDGATVTTRLPGGETIHTNFDSSGNCTGSDAG